MSQTAFTVRMDSETKKKFDELCKDFGMSANTAFNVFARTVVKQGRIPFSLESEAEIAAQRARDASKLMRRLAAQNGINDMSIDEIDQEIKMFREEKRNKIK